MSLFIAIDGPDGTGKSTLARELARRLSSDAGVRTIATCEPHLPTTRAYLSDPTVSARELLIAFAFDRDVHLREVVEPALTTGYVVICDRYTYSTVAYQSLHNPPELVQALVSHVRKPDLTILLSCPVEIAMARSAARKGTPDRYDYEGAAELQGRLHAAYAECAAKDPSAVIIDASQSPEDVLETALFVVRGEMRRRAQARQKGQHQVGLDLKPLISSTCVEKLYTESMKGAVKYVLSGYLAPPASDLEVTTQETDDGGLEVSVKTNDPALIDVWRKGGLLPE